VPSVADPLARPSAGVAPHDDARRTLVSVLRFLGRRWWVLVLVTAGLLYAVRRYADSLPRTYACNPVILELLTDVPAGDRSFGAYEYAIATTTYYVVPTQRAVLATREVLDPVIDRLGLAGDPRYANLAGHVVTTSQENTALIHLAVRGPDPERNAEIANALAREYARQRKQQRIGYVEELVKGAEADVVAREKELHDAEEAERKWKEEKRVANVETDQATMNVRLNQVYEVFGQAQSDRLTAAEAAAQVAAAKSEGRWLGDVTAVLADGRVQDEIDDLRRLEERAREVEADRQRTKDQVAEARDAAAKQKERVEARIRARAAEIEIAARAAVTREGAAKQQLDDVQREIARLVNLRIEHDNLVATQKRAQTDLVEAKERRRKGKDDLAKSGEAVRIWGWASASHAPVAPNLQVIYAGGALLSFLVALGLAVLLDVTSTRLRDPAEVARVAEAPFLGIVPLIPKTKDQPTPSRRALEETDGEASEAYRLIAASATLHGGEGVAPKTFVVTSPQAGDGKTTTAVGLAMALARRGKSVLLVDADLRKPSLHSVLETAVDPGLTTLFSGRPVWEAVRTLEVSSPGHSPVRLDVLTAGVLPPNPADLLAGPIMQDFVRDARARYDAVVIDTPPVNLASDASLLAQSTDAVLLVIRDARTHRGMLHRAVTRLRGVRGNVRGVLLNAMRASGGGRYGYGYGYGYRYGYGHDGRGKATAQAAGEAGRGNGRAPAPGAPSPATIRVVARTEPSART
jgi:capsular exopolysaccharide synthesis family protein